LSGNSTGNGNGNSATQTPATKKRKEEPTASVSDDQSKRNKTSVYRSGSRPIAPAPAPGGSTSLANNTEKSPSKQVTSSQPKPNAETEDILSELEEKHRTALCSAFMGEEWDQLPTVLTQLPSNMDFDISLDMMGNSALHWAAVLGHIKVVEFLVKKGATQTLPNHHGVTPLARAVMERYNYDYKTFPRMIVLLAPCLNHLDKYRRSVFHYVVFTAKDPERVSAALYYLKCLMDFIVERRLDAAKALNLQDEDGNTALNIAVNLGIGEIITLLHEAGANPSIPNKAGVAPEDYGPNWANPRASSSQDTTATHNSASQAINPPSGYAENFFPSSTRIGSTSLISKATQLSTMVTNFIQELEADFQHRLSVEANKCDRLQAELNEAKQTIHYLEEQLSICRPPSYFPHHIGGDNHKSGLSSSLPSQHHSFSSSYYNSYKSRDRASMPKTPQTRNTNGPKLLPSATQNLPPILPRPPVNEFNSPKITDKSSQTTTPKVGRQSSKKPAANSQPQSATPISPLSKYSTLKEVKSTQVPSNGETNEISDDEIASYTPYSIQPQAISLPRNTNKVSPPPPTESATPGDLSTPPELKQKEKSPISKKQPRLEFDDSLEIMEDAESDSHDNLDTTQSPDYFPDH
jgi:ankyrin repeat protein